MNARVDDAGPDASIHAENETQETKDANHTNQRLVLSENKNTVSRISYRQNYANKSVPISKEKLCENSSNRSCTCSEGNAPADNWKRENEERK
jgi:hypothetical protein